MTMPRIPPMIAILLLSSLLPMDPFRNTGALKSLEDQQPPRIIQVLHRRCTFLCVVFFHRPEDRSFPTNQFDYFCGWWSRIPTLSFFLVPFLRVISNYGAGVVRRGAGLILFVRRIRFASTTIAALAAEVHFQQFQFIVQFRFPFEEFAALSLH